MLYYILHVITGFALRWFYREVRIQGAGRISRDGPVLLAANHPNALVDALVIGWVVPRRITLTAKATLFENPFRNWLIRSAGGIPLRRASDEAQRSPTIDRSRNEQSFGAILDTLERRGAVVIFPEGRSHSDPQLSPLKTGLARIALQARDERSIRGLEIVPLGLVFEEKGTPRTRVLVEVGAPVLLDDWRPEPGGPAPAQQLTEVVNERLRAVTLNFPSAEHARQVLTVAEVLAHVYEDDVRSLRDPDPPLSSLLAVTRRVDQVRRAIDDASAVDATRVARFTERLDAFRLETETRGIAVNDIAMTTAASPALRFLARETAVVLLAGPLAWWGRINHWIPFRLARWHTTRRPRAGDQPAMQTIVAGLALVLFFYGLQTALVASWLGWKWALLYLISLPLSATWDLRYRDRMERAMQRVRAWTQLRRDQALHARLREEVGWLRDESAALEALTTATAAVRGA